MKNNDFGILNRNLRGFRFKNLTTANYNEEFSIEMNTCKFKIGFFRVLDLKTLHQFLMVV